MENSNWSVRHTVQQFRLPVINCQIRDQDQAVKCKWVDLRRVWIVMKFYNKNGLPQKHPSQSIVHCINTKCRWWSKTQLELPLGPNCPFGLSLLEALFCRRFCAQRQQAFEDMEVEGLTKNNSAIIVHWRADGISADSSPDQ